MPDERVSIIVDSKDQASATIQGIAGQLQGLAGIVGGGALTAGFMKAADGLKNLAVQASTLGAVQASFRNLATSAGQDAERLVAALKTASRGTVSEMKLMQSANTAMLLMGGEVASKLPAFMEIARASAKATGQSVDYMFESIVRGVGRASPRILDNLGMTVSLSEAYEKYAQSIGKASDELSKQEQVMALANEVERQGADFIGRMGEASNNAGTKVKAFGVHVEELKMQLGQALVPALSTAMDVAEKMLSALDSPVVRTAIIAFGGLATAIAGVVGPLMMVAGATKAWKALNMTAMLKDIVSGLGGMASAAGTAVTALGGIGATAALLGPIAIGLAVVGVVIAKNVQYNKDLKQAAEQAAEAHMYKYREIAAMYGDRGQQILDIAKKLETAKQEAILLAEAEMKQAAGGFMPKLPGADWAHNLLLSLGVVKKGYADAAEEVKRFEKQLTSVEEAVRAAALQDEFTAWASGAASVSAQMREAGVRIDEALGQASESMRESRGVWQDWVDSQEAGYKALEEAGIDWEQNVRDNVERQREALNDLRGSWDEYISAIGQAVGKAAQIQQEYAGRIADIENESVQSLAQMANEYQNERATIVARGEAEAFRLAAEGKQAEASMAADAMQTQLSNLEGDYNYKLSLQAWQEDVARVQAAIARRTALDDLVSDMGAEWLLRQQFDVDTLRAVQEGMGLQLNTKINGYIAQLEAQEKFNNAVYELTVYAGISVADAMRIAGREAMRAFQEGISGGGGKTREQLEAELRSLYRSPPLPTAGDLGAYMRDAMGSLSTNLSRATQSASTGRTAAQDLSNIVTDIASAVDSAINAINKLLDFTGAKAEQVAAKAETLFTDNFNKIIDAIMHAGWAYGDQNRDWRDIPRAAAEFAGWVEKVAGATGQAVSALKALMEMNLPDVTALLPKSEQLEQGIKYLIDQMMHAGWAYGDANRDWRDIPRAAAEFAGWVVKISEASNAALTAINNLQEWHPADISDKTERFTASMKTLVTSLGIGLAELKKELGDVANDASGFAEQAIKTISIVDPGIKAIHDLVSYDPGPNYEQLGNRASVLIGHITWVLKSMQEAFLKVPEPERQGAYWKPLSDWVAIVNTIISPVKAFIETIHTLIAYDPGPGFERLGERASVLIGHVTWVVREMQDAFLRMPQEQRTVEFSKPLADWTTQVQAVLAPIESFIEAIHLLVAYDPGPNFAQIGEKAALLLSNVATVMRSMNTAFAEWGETGYMTPAEYQPLTDWMATISPVMEGIDKLIASIKALAQYKAVTADLGVAATAVLNDVAGAMRAMNSAFAGWQTTGYMTPAEYQALTDWWDAISPVMSTIKEMIESIRALGKFASPGDLTSNATSLMTAVGQVLTALRAAFEDLARNPDTGIPEEWGKELSQTVQNVGTMMAAIQNFIDGLKAILDFTIPDVSPDWVELKAIALGDLVRHIFDGLKTAFENLREWDSETQEWTSGGGVVSNTISNVANAVGAVSAFIESVAAILDFQIPKATPDWLELKGTALGDLVRHIFNGLKTAFEGLREWDSEAGEWVSGGGVVSGTIGNVATAVGAVTAFVESVAAILDFHIPNENPDWLELKGIALGDIVRHIFDGLTTAFQDLNEWDDTAQEWVAGGGVVSDSISNVATAVGAITAFIESVTSILDFQIPNDNPDWLQLKAIALGDIVRHIFDGLRIAFESLKEWDDTSQTWTSGGGIVSGSIGNVATAVSAITAFVESVAAILDFHIPNDNPDWLELKAIALGDLVRHIFDGLRIAFENLREWDDTTETWVSGGGVVSGTISNVATAVGAVQAFVESIAAILDFVIPNDNPDWLELKGVALGDLVRHIFDGLQIAFESLREWDETAQAWVSGGGIVSGTISNVATAVGAITGFVESVAAILDFTIPKDSPDWLELKGTALGDLVRHIFDGLKTAFENLKEWDDTTQKWVSGGGIVGGTLSNVATAVGAVKAFVESVVAILEFNIPNDNPDWLELKGVALGDLVRHIFDGLKTAFETLREWDSEAGEWVSGGGIVSGAIVNVATAVGAVTAFVESLAAMIEFHIPNENPDWLELKAIALGDIVRHIFDGLKTAFENLKEWDAETKTWVAGGGLVGGTIGNVATAVGAIQTFVESVTAILDFHIPNDNPDWLELKGLALGDLVRHIFDGLKTAFESLKEWDATAKTWVSGGGIVSGTITNVATAVGAVKAFVESVTAILDFTIPSDNPDWLELKGTALGDLVRHIFNGLKTAFENLREWDPETKKWVSSGSVVSGAITNVATAVGAIKAFVESITAILEFRIPNDNPDWLELKAIALGDIVRHIFDGLNTAFRGLREWDEDTKKWVSAGGVVSGTISNVATAVGAIKAFIESVTGIIEFHIPDENPDWLGLKGIALGDLVRHIFEGLKTAFENLREWDDTAKQWVAGQGVIAGTLGNIATAVGVVKTFIDSVTAIADWQPRKIGARELSTRVTALSADVRLMFTGLAQMFQSFNEIGPKVDGQATKIAGQGAISGTLVNISAAVGVIKAFIDSLSALADWQPRRMGAREISTRTAALAADIRLVFDALKAAFATFTEAGPEVDGQATRIAGQGVISSTLTNISSAVSVVKTFIDSLTSITEWQPRQIGAREISLRVTALASDVRLMFNALRDAFADLNEIGPQVDGEATKIAGQGAIAGTLQNVANAISAVRTFIDTATALATYRPRALDTAKVRQLAVDARAILDILDSEFSSLIETVIEGELAKQVPGKDLLAKTMANVTNIVGSVGTFITALSGLRTYVGTDLGAARRLAHDAKSVIQEFVTEFAGTSDTWLEDIAQWWDRATSILSPIASFIDGMRRLATHFSPAQSQIQAFVRDVKRVLDEMQTVFGEQPEDWLEAVQTFADRAQSGMTLLGSALGVFDKLAEFEGGKWITPQKIDVLVDMIQYLAENVIWLAYQMSPVMLEAASVFAEQCQGVFDMLKSALDFLNQLGDPKNTLASYSAIDSFLAAVQYIAGQLGIVGSQVQGMVESSVGVLAAAADYAANMAAAGAMMAGKGPAGVNGPVSVTLGDLEPTGPQRPSRSYDWPSFEGRPTYGGGGGGGGGGGDNRADPEMLEILADIRDLLVAEAIDDPVRRDREIGDIARILGRRVYASQRTRA